MAVQPIKNLVASIEDEPRCLKLSFQTDCVIPNQIPHIARKPKLLSKNRGDDYRLFKDEIDVLRELADLCRCPGGRQVEIQFRIGSDDTSFRKLLSMLPTQDRNTCSPTLTKLRWEPYRHRNKEIFIGPLLLKARMPVLTQGHPGIQSQRHLCLSIVTKSWSHVHTVLISSWKST